MTPLGGIAGLVVVIVNPLFKKVGIQESLFNAHVNLLMSEAKITCAWEGDYNHFSLMLSKPPEKHYHPVQKDLDVYLSWKLQLVKNVVMLLAWRSENQGSIWPQFPKGCTVALFWEPG